MVCGATAFNGKSEMVGFEAKMDSKYYTEVLENALPPNADSVVGEDWKL